MTPLVLACSACGDAIFRTTWWWAPAFGPLLLGLLVEGVLFTVVARVKGATPRAHRAYVGVAALVIPVATTIVGVGTVVGVWLMCALLVVAAVRSIILNRSLGRALLFARSALLVLGVISGVHSALPSERELEELLRTALYVVRFDPGENWLFEELRRRPDTRTRLNARLADDDATQALALHAQLGLPAEDRAAACARLPTPRGKSLAAACP